MSSKRVLIAPLVRQFPRSAATGIWPLRVSIPRPLPRSRRAVSAQWLRPIGFRGYSSDADIKIWNFEQVQKLTKDPNTTVVLVDAREPAELKQSGRIPGAINVPVTSAPDSFHVTGEEFEDRFGFPRPDKDMEIVFYCKAGVRSRAAARLAKEAGWTKVGEYPGSYTDWEGKGGKIQR